MTTVINQTSVYCLHMQILKCLYVLFIFVSSHCLLQFLVLLTSVGDALVSNLKVISTTNA